MATTIGALAYRISADTGQFTKDMNLTGRQIGKLNRLFKETREPAEIAAGAIDDLNKLYKDGTIDADLYSRAVNKIKAEQDGLSKGGGRVVEFFQKLTPVLHGVQLIFSGISTGISTVTNGFQKIMEVTGEINQLNEFRKRLSLGGEEFAALEVIAHRMGFDVEKLVDGTAELTKRIAEAVKIQSGTGFDALGDEGLGLTVDQMRELSQLNAFEQVKKVADMIGRVNNESEQLRLIDELFATEELVPLARLTAAGFEQAAKDAKRFNLALAGSPLDKLNETATAFQDMQLALKGVVRVIAGVGAEGFREIGNAIAEMATAFAEMIKNDPQALLRTLKDLTEILKDLIGLMQERLPAALEDIARGGVVSGTGRATARNLLPAAARRIPGIGHLVSERALRALPEASNRAFDSIFGRGGEEVKKNTTANEKTAKAVEQLRLMGVRQGGGVVLSTVHDIR